MTYSILKRLIAGTALLTPTAVTPAASDNPEPGKRLALLYCARCHATDKRCISGILSKPYGKRSPKESSPAIPACRNFASMPITSMTSSLS